MSFVNPTARDPTIKLHRRVTASKTAPPPQVGTEFETSPYAAGRAGRASSTEQTFPVHPGSHSHLPFMCIPFSEQRFVNDVGLTSTIPTNTPIVTPNIVPNLQQTKMILSTNCLDLPLGRQKKNSSRDLTEASAISVSECLGSRVPPRTAARSLSFHRKDAIFSRTAWIATLYRSVSLVLRRILITIC